MRLARWALLSGALLGLAAPETRAETAAPEVRQDARVEIEVDRNDLVHALPAGEAGVLVAVGRRSVGATRWTLERYDASLKRQGEPAALDVPSDAALSAWQREEGTYHLLFHAPGARRFALVEVPLAGGAPRARTLQAPQRVAELSELVVVGRDAYVQGLRGSRGRLWHVDLDAAAPEARVLDLPPDSPRKYGLQRLAPSRAGDQADVVVYDLKGRRRALALLGYSGGELRSTLTIEPEPGEGNLLSAQRSRLADGSTLVVGTYAAREKGGGAQGLFVARYQGDRRVAMERHSFTDFPGFLSHLSDRREERLERKAARKKAKGGDLELGLDLLIHDIIEQEGRLLLIAESYVPVYVTQTRTVTTTGANGQTQTQTQTYQVFVGWQTTHALVAALDPQGGLLWAETFPMGEGLSPQLKERVRVQAAGDAVRLRYAAGEKLYTREIGADALTGPREGEELAVGAAEDDRARRTAETDLEWWYGDAFLLWGYQKVKGEEEGARRVFFFSRIGPG